MKTTLLIAALTLLAWACGSEGPSATDTANDGGGGGDGAGGADLEDALARDPAGEGAFDQPTQTDGTDDVLGVDAPNDDVANDTEADDGQDTREPDAGRPTYERAFSYAAEHAAPDGYLWRRGIVHLHSSHSHDACDGEPRPDGEYNLPCIASLRAALCRVRVDFAYLTDHRVHMGETPFEDLLLHDPETDTLVDDSGVVYANQIACDDGHVVTVTVGMETELMPLRFIGPLSDDPETNLALLGGEDAEAAGRFRDGGALVWRAHTEGIDATWALDRGLDGFEIYNLHANIDPRIRENLLGLPGFAIFDNLVPFILERIPTSPDLALLTFLTDNEPSLDTWAQVLSVRPIVGTAGTDAHENVLPPPMVDGERFDSYRRMMSWFSNYVLATDDSPHAFHEALAAGRLFIGFDTLASPDGFDAHVELPSGERLELGADATFVAGSSVVVTVPQLLDERAAGTTTIARLLRVEDGTWSLVDTADGPGEHRFDLDTAGIYRAEVRITPRHLAPYMAELADLASNTFPWIYGNAFRLMAPIDR